MEILNDTTYDDLTREEVMRRVLRELSDMDLSQSPPAMAKVLHDIIRGIVTAEDPYREKKKASNDLAVRLYPGLRREVLAAADPLEQAVRLTIAANIIDFGAKSGLKEQDVHDAVEDAMQGPFDGDVRAFKEMVDEAQNILYLADNAGEIVFDKLLLEQLPCEKITLAVRGGPVINDATLEDAEVAGIEEFVPVIANGSKVPGTVLSDCSPEFRKVFEKSDLIIAKGQGNYETLSDCRKRIVFLLKVKCPVVARDLDEPLGELVLKV